LTTKRTSPPCALALCLATALWAPSASAASTTPGPDTWEVCPAHEPAWRCAAVGRHSFTVLASSYESARGGFVFTRNGIAGAVASGVFSTPANEQSRAGQNHRTWVKPLAWGSVLMRTVTFENLMLDPIAARHDAAPNLSLDDPSPEAETRIGTVASIAEPETALSMIGGLCLLVWMTRRRRGDWPTHG
jgi:hypothetical protein